MIRFPLVPSRSVVLTATCRDLKALKDESCSNILRQPLHFFDPCRISSRLLALVSASVSPQLQQRLYWSITDRCLAVELLERYMYFVHTPSSSQEKRLNLLPKPARDMFGRGREILHSPAMVRGSWGARWQATDSLNVGPGALTQPGLTNQILKSRRGETLHRFS